MKVSETSPAPRWFIPVLFYAALASSVVTSLGTLLVPFVATMYNIPVSQAQWMFTVNLLVGAVVTPVMGRLSDGPHTKRLLLIGLGVIVVGSVVGACQIK